MVLVRDPEGRDVVGEQGDRAGTPVGARVLVADHRGAHGVQAPERVGLVHQEPYQVAGEPVARWLGGARAADFPLHLLANQPASRLHSQLDSGATSKASKVQGREPIRMNQADADARGLIDGDVVRVFNDRGACLAGLVIDDRVRPDVVQLSTGAWFDPASRHLERHGNPNVLTLDAGTSRLAQGTSALSALVQAERWHGEVPPVQAFE